MTQSYISRRYVVEGLVQGVGFRWWTRKTASRLGLGGWVRNLPDGSVEIDAVGTAEQHEAFEALLDEGPLSAEVRRMTVTEKGPRTERGEFEIRFEGS